MDWNSVMTRNGVKYGMKLKLPEKVVSVMQKVEVAGGEIFVVGGAVRDLMLGLEVKDWDFATNLTPDEMKKIFPKNSFCENVYGTFSIVLKDGEIFEVTTYRTEREYTDGRHPDKVEWGETIEDDLKRRDFTINAMAVDIKGKVFDIYEGRADIQNRLIKAVGNADERFKEDALRMMRAVRIACQIEFVIEDKTFEAMQVNAESINKIAGERIRDELFKILTSGHSVDGVKLLKSAGLLVQIMPEMLAGEGLKQRGHHIYDVLTHSLEALKSCESTDPITLLATLIHDIGKPQVMKTINGTNTFHNHDIVGSRIANRIGKRLRLSNKELDKLFRLVRWHMFTASEMQTDSAVRRLIRNVTPEYLQDMIDLRRADRVGSGAKETSWRWELLKKRFVEVQKQPFSVKDLKVDGNDVMKILEIKPSRKVGEVLDKLFAEVEKDVSLNVREILIEKIRQIG
ncbi:HD domain-containing protein [Candidatus Shapirobacteria bacterium]|nr:HD domain-containing protein [Candidatus Shapirobacteria bacterium]